jgi:hypothetical protein
MSLPPPPTSGPILFKMSREPTQWPETRKQYRSREAIGGGAAATDILQSG